jgi:hypothetical protein
MDLELIHKKEIHRNITLINLLDINMIKLKKSRGT